MARHYDIRGETSYHRQWLFAVVLLLPLLYVLSYAPVVRAMGGWTAYPVQNWNGRYYPIKAPVCGTTTLQIYRPVDWLIDETRYSACAPCSSISSPNRPDPH